MNEHPLVNVVNFMKTVAEMVIASASQSKAGRKKDFAWIEAHEHELPVSLRCAVAVMGAMPAIWKSPEELSADMDFLIREAEDARSTASLD